MIQHNTNINFSDKYTLFVTIDKEKPINDGTYKFYNYNQYIARAIITIKKIYPELQTKNFPSIKYIDENSLRLFMIAFDDIYPHKVSAYLEKNNETKICVKKSNEIMCDDIKLKIGIEYPTDKIITKNGNWIDKNMFFCYDIDMCDGKAANYVNIKLMISYDISNCEYDYAYIVACNVSNCDNNDCQNQWQLIEKIKNSDNMETLLFALKIYVALNNHLPFKYNNVNIKCNDISDVDLQHILHMSENKYAHYCDNNMRYEIFISTPENPIPFMFTMRDIGFKPKYTFVKFLQILENCYRYV